MLLYAGLAIAGLLLIALYRLYRAVLNPPVEVVDLKRFPKKYEPATEVGLDVHVGIATNYIK